MIAKMNPVYMYIQKQDIEHNELSVLIVVKHDGSFYIVL